MGEGEWKETAEMSDLLTQLNEPFDVKYISWRPGQTTKDKSKCMALVYADLRAYMERLDAICGINWSNRYVFSSDGRIICELTINGITRSSTGESDAQDEKNNLAGSVSEAMAFKRACAMWGLGRYLYNLPDAWVEFDAGSGRISKAGLADLEKRYRDWYARVKRAPQPTQDAPAQAVGAETDGDSHKAEIEPPDDAEAELMNSWKSPADAQAWAVAMGACENIHEARNSFLNVVNDKFGGKCNKTNIAAIYLVYMRKQESKLEEMFTQFSEKMAAK